ncbi:hypothetical protein EVA_04611 [gut metagenome]|uniref:Uncharacterized protein n=1 Tax=gut metagenome TaxID=749906 RepID=J9GWA7_9ZZZZ
MDNFALYLLGAGSFFACQLLQSLICAESAFSGASLHTAERYGSEVKASETLLNCGKGFLNADNEHIILVFIFGDRKEFCFLGSFTQGALHVGKLNFCRNGAHYKACTFRSFSVKRELQIEPGYEGLNYSTLTAFLGAQALNLIVSICYPPCNGKSRIKAAIGNQFLRVNLRQCGQELAFGRCVFV